MDSFAKIPARHSGESRSPEAIENDWIALKLHYVPGFRRNDNNLVFCLFAN
jgi:hypothetical protein